MELRNLFDRDVKAQIIARINKLTPQSQPQWGKMNVSQMLAHLRVPIEVAEGTKTLPRSFMGRLFGPLARPAMYSPKPFRRNLPTDRSFIMTGTEKNFEEEKRGLLQLIENFKEENISDQPHPFFGRFTTEQWSKSMYKHLDHHLQQFGV